MKQSKNGIGKVLGWFFGIIFIISGITELKDEFIFGLTMIILGAYLVPPVTAKVSEITKIDLSGWRKLVGFLMGFIGMAIIAAIFSTAEDITTPPVAEPVIITKTQEKIETAAVVTEPTSGQKEIAEVPKEAVTEIDEVDEVSEEPNATEPVAVDAELIERLNREIKSLNEGVDFSGFYDNVLGIQMGAALFGTWAIMIEEGEQSQNPEAQALAKKLRQKVSQFQVVQFPKLRQAYGKAVREQVWEHNVEVDVFGNANGTIQFTGYVFADNGNKKMIQEMLYEMLILLRFDQSRFKWYRADDEYTYFTLDSALDSKVQIIK